MSVFLTGGTGFIGQHLVRSLISDDVDCVVLSRSGRDPWHHDRVRVVRGDPTRAGEWQREISGTQAVVNLAGEPLVDPTHRWTDARKQSLRNSRVWATRNVVDAIREAATAPAVLISASAVGYYGNRGDEVLDESASAGEDFLAHLSIEWEQAALQAQDLTRVAIVRTGMVLARGGGVLNPLLPIFKLGLGGPWGSGDQWWPWIHMADEVGLLRFAIEREITGPINLSAPNPVTVRQFTRALGNALGRPTVLPVPAPMLRLALGEAADALLASLRVVPKRAENAGYKFAFPVLEGALQEIFDVRAR